MTRAWFAAMVIAVTAAALLAAASAGAASNRGGLTVERNSVTLLTIPARFAGQLTVAFHGDSASGCASSGLCGYAGTVSWRPPATGDLTVFAYREHGHIAYTLDLSAFSTSFPGAPGGVTTANEQLSAPGSIVSSCVDAVPTGNSFALPFRRGRVSFSRT